MPTTKTLNFPEDVQNALRQAVIKQSGNEWTLDLVGQMDRSLYGKIKKAIESMGGKWNRSRKTHIFFDNPVEHVKRIVEDGSLKIANYGHFPTPESIIKQMAEGLGWLSPQAIYLEPSAGDGDIACYLHQHLEVPRKNITCVEVHHDRADRLKQLGFETHQADFYIWETNEVFDWILMNPPL